MMRLLLLTLLLSVTACTTSPPHKPGDICAIFKEKDDWYDEAKDASKRWNSPIPVMMSIMYQESRFVAKAKPPRKFWLGFIPAGRMSDAYGYAQAKDATWKWYKDKSGNWGADRDDFDDATHFISPTTRGTAALSAALSRVNRGSIASLEKCRRGRRPTPPNWPVARKT